MQKQAPEIFQLPLTSLDLTGLPSNTDPGFEQAVIAHYALQYAAKGWNAAVVVSDGIVRVVAVPQQGIEPKAYLLGLLRHRYIDDALPGLEANRGDTYRVAYTVRFEKAVYVLHCFQKKSPSGIRTAKTDVDLIHERLRAAQTDYEARYGKEG